MIVPTSQGGFAGIFASPTLVGLLRVFLLRPDEDFYQRELAHLTASRLAQVQRDLARLEAAGLVGRRRRGNRVYYRATTGHPAFKDLQAVVVKTIGVVGVIKDALAPFLGQVSLAFVFGSVAEGRQMGHSDVDVLVIADEDPRDLVTALAEAGERLGREVNTVVTPAAELKARLEGGQSFARGVVDGAKLWLVGDEAELARLLRVGADSVA